MPASPIFNRQSVETSRPSLEPPTTSSNAHSLTRAVYERRADYTRSQRLRIKIGSWNVAACPGTERDLKGWFGEGKGLDERLSGLVISPGGEQQHIESIESQEARTSKLQSTLPEGEQGVLPAGEEIGLYVLGLQEVVELASAKQYIGNVYSDTTTISKWKLALQESLPEGYTLVAEQQLSGLVQLIFASPKLTPSISSISIVSVGTGIMGYLGNKGGIATRLLLGETTRIVFVNSHLASGNDAGHLERRCWDATQIVQRAVFDPISWGGVLDDKQETIGDEDFAFWFGDLNFRLDLPGEDIRRLLTLHTKGEYDLEKKLGSGDASKVNKQPRYTQAADSDDEDDDETPYKTVNPLSVSDDELSINLPDPDEFVDDPSQNPASLQATLDSLLPHDQLRHVQKKRKAFHDGWREGQIKFLPTYKYDVGSVAVFDSSEKKRSPSWCDRILFRTRRDRLEYEGRSQEEDLARIKDAEMKARGIDEAGVEEDVLFDYNPDEDEIGEQPAPHEYDEYDEEADNQPEEVLTTEGYVDKIHLDVYTSHQRVLSSDHKPLEAIFTLDYEAVIPELKSITQQEVARELDKAENETRPGITIIVEHSQDEESALPDIVAQQPSTEDFGSVNFGPVAYQQRKVRSLTIANTGQVQATFAFVARPDPSSSEERVSPLWVSVHFQTSEPDDTDYTFVDPRQEKSLQPGETVSVVLGVFIDDLSLLRGLNSCTVQLDDILVLRVTDGRDHFIPLRGSWQQSCFGRSVEELIHIPEGGVRALMPRRDAGDEHDAAPVNPGQEVSWSAPRELFKLTEAIEQLASRVVADANMIETAQIPLEASGWPFDSQSWLLRDVSARENRKQNVLEALDSDKDLNNSFSAEVPAIERLEIISEILIDFLLSMTDGIVPASLWAQLDVEFTSHASNTVTDPEEMKSWVLDVLSSLPNHNISFVFLVSMLCKVANEVAPVPKLSWRQSMVGNARNGFSNMRRSLSIRTRGKRESESSSGSDDPAVIRREAVEKAFAGVFAGVIFRGGKDKSAKERRLVDDRRKEILGAFLKAGRDN